MEQTEKRLYDVLDALDRNPQNEFIWTDVLDEIKKYREYWIQLNGRDAIPIRTDRGIMVGFPMEE